MVLEKKSKTVKNKNKLQTDGPPARRMQDKSDQNISHVSFQLKWAKNGLTILSS